MNVKNILTESIKPENKSNVIVINISVNEEGSFEINSTEFMKT